MWASPFATRHLPLTGFRGTKNQFLSGTTTSGPYRVERHLCARPSVFGRAPGCVLRRHCRPRHAPLTSGRQWRTMILIWATSRMTIWREGVSSRAIMTCQCPPMWACCVFCRLPISRCPMRGNSSVRRFAMSLRRRVLHTLPRVLRLPTRRCGGRSFRQ